MTTINIDLDNKILDNQEQRHIQIYKIVNKINNKIYIGQCVSHILNHKKYRPYGYIGRFKCHLSEAKSNKKQQSRILNNALLKYGVDNFNIEIIYRCSENDADKYELEFITKYNSLYPNGYNIKNGGTQFKHTEYSRKQLSISGKQYYIDKKLKKTADINILEYDVNKIIRPLNRNKEQYGWYLYFRRDLKLDFGGSHTDLKTSKEDAIIFFNKLMLNHSIKKATYLNNRETPKDLTTT
jgi:group I intron endonuclease